MNNFELPKSTPSFTEFKPLPGQAKVLDDLFFNFDYSLGVHEVLLSGSVGSFKTLTMAHAGIRHLITYPNARCLLGRLALPDLRDTLYRTIVEHLDGMLRIDGEPMIDGRDYWTYDPICRVRFSNGSEFIARTWRDKKFRKLQSLQLSAALVEQIEENDGDYWSFYKFLIGRLGRLPHVPQSFIIAAANPDSPQHPVYEYFEIDKHIRAR